MNNDSKLWAVIMGSVFLAAAIISVVPPAWAVWVFFGVVGIALLIYGLVKRQ